MEIPVQVAVRLKPPSAEDSTQCIFSNASTQAVLTQSGQTFRVSRALASDCSQAQVYTSISPPQLTCFLDGCDTSVVAVGASKSGKTYTMFGQGFECIHSECDQGMVPRFITDLFQKLNQLPEREFTVHLTWMQVIGGALYDVLGSGLVRVYNVEEAFQYLQLGWRSRCQGECHTMFTVTMEQKWVGTNGALNHRLSTASFCDLAPYPDQSLYALENVIQSLLTGHKLINYDQSILTAMLRDSFGGRAFTWVMGCISTDPQDFQETLRTLNFSLCCLGIKNFVTVNTFSDNNTPALEKFITPSSNTVDGHFSLQFAAGQWVKLVSNAEGLFNKILQSKSLNEAEAEQISKWLVLKAECDECVIGDNEDKEALQKQGLPRIAEDTEPSEPSESDVESDCESSQSDTVFQDRIEKFMDYFREKNDQLYADRCEEYLNHIDSDDITLSETSGSQSITLMTSQSLSGRRRTIQPGESLSGTELELLRKVAAKAISPESQKIIMESHKKDIDPEPKLIQRELLKMIDSPTPTDQCKKYKVNQEKFVQKQTLARKLSKEIESSQIQLRELIGLCISKEHLINELSRIIRNNTSNKTYNESISLKDDYQKAKNDFALAQSKASQDKNNTKLIQNVNRCKALVDQHEKRNREFSSIDHDTAKEIRKHENKLKSYKKQIEQIQRQIKKDEKRKNTLDVELAKDKIKLDELSERDCNGDVKEKKLNSLKHVTSRLTQLDSVIREKASSLQKSEHSDHKELMLRKEIKNLRKTRECLHEQRCSLGYKRKIYKSLSDSEERKIFECEEAIEAIDTAIEYKNALICGRSPSASLSDPQCEQDGTTKGEQMLMARLDKLSHDEMKTLLYKYFQKVVDLRGACSALESSAAAAAAETAEWRARATAAWRQAQRSRQATQTRQYQAVQRVVNAGGYDRALSLGMTSDSDMSEDALRLVNRMRQLTRYQQPPVIPSQNLKQLMPAVSEPVAKVTKQKNKLVIIQEKKN